MSEVQAGGKAWARGIVIACSLFVCTTIGFVLFAFTQRVDLVSRDYYQREIEHQRHIDRVERTGELPEGVGWEVRQEGEAILFGFPLEKVEGELRGSIYFYRPSNADLDRRMPIDLDEKGAQRLPLARLAAGRWRVEIDWRLGDAEYYEEFDLMVE